MKYKSLILAIFIFCFNIAIVNAESNITYNLTIDDEAHFYEQIKYEVGYNDIDNKSYNFPTSVVKDTIYFNKDKTTKYNKKIKKTNLGYIVTLTNDYAPIFLNDQRIINECFNDYELKTTNDEVSLDTEAPFYCTQRANNITINIKTNLSVTQSNADSVVNNTYTWTVKDRNFNLRFGVSMPTNTDENTEPLDDVDNDTDTDSTSDNNQNNPQDSNKPTDTQTDDTNNQKNSNPLTGIIIATIVLALSVGIIITVITLKIKKNQINKI